MSGENAQGKKSGLSAKSILMFGCLGSLALLVIGILAALFIVILPAINIHNEGVKLQNELNGRYVDNQNVLSTYLSKLHNELGVSTANTNDLDKVLSDAMKSGYTAACNGSDCGFSKGAPFYGAVLKAYPSLGDVTSIYSKILQTIEAGETAFGQVQTLLIDKLRSFDTWRESTGVAFYSWLPGCSFPDSNLVARVGNSVPQTGESAENQMWTIVTTSDTQHSFTTGTRQDQQTPVATPSK